MIGLGRPNAIRVTHIPTGEVVTVELTRPSHTWAWARERALAILRGRLWARAHGAGRSAAEVVECDLGEREYCCGRVDLALLDRGHYYPPDLDVGTSSVRPDVGALGDKHERI
jgi:hypothetical protein